MVILKGKLKSVKGLLVYLIVITVLYKILNRLSLNFITCLLKNFVTDLINRIIQVLKGDLYWVKISVQDTELIKPVKP